MGSRPSSGLDRDRRIHAVKTVTAIAVEANRKAASGLTRVQRRRAIPETHIPLSGRGLGHPALERRQLLLKAALSKNRRSVYYRKKRGEPYRTLSWSHALGRTKTEKEWPRVDGRPVDANLQHRPWTRCPTCADLRG